MNREQVASKIHHLRGVVLRVAATPNTNWWEVSYYLDMAEEVVKAIGAKALRYENWDMSKELLRYQSRLIFPPANLQGKPLKQWYRSHGSYHLPDGWMDHVGIRPATKELL